MPQTCEMPHGGTLTSFSWKQTLWKKASSSSSGHPLFSLCVAWKVSVCQAFKHSLSIFPLYLVWLVSSHYCCFMFGRASRASMERGRRAVCAQPCHLAAQRGRGAWRAAERRKRVSGKKTFSLLFFSLVFSQAFCSVIRSFFPPLSSCFHTLSLSPPSWLSLTGFNRLFLITSMVF